MKFLISKNDNIFCIGCGSNILYGEHYIGVFYIDKELRRRKLLFHVKCYYEWYTANVLRKYEMWKSSLTEPKKRGRPKIYQNGKEVHKLKALLYYYRKAGNEPKVLELEAKLEGLKVT